MPVHECLSEAALQIAVPAKPRDEITHLLSRRMDVLQRVDTPEFTDLVGIVTRIYKRPWLQGPNSVEVDKWIEAVRISDEQVISTWPDLLKGLVKRGDAKPAILSFAFSISPQIRQLLESPDGMSGYIIAGLSLRDRFGGGDNFYAYHSPEGHVNANLLALSFIDNTNINSLLSLSFFKQERSNTEEITVDWAGRIFMETAEPLSDTEVIDRYEEIKKSFSIEIEPYADRVLRLRGVHKDIRKEFREGNLLIPKKAA